MGFFDNFFIVAPVVRASEAPATPNVFNFFGVSRDPFALIGEGISL